MRLNLYSWVFINSFFCSVTIAQTNNISFISYEKIFVDTDRSQYIAGDTLWFKVYLENGNFYLPDSLNATVHCVLINSESQTVKHIITKARSAGQIILPDSLRKGYYQLAAYTNAMFSEHSKSIFRKTLHIWSNKQSTIDRLTVSSDNPPLQFFPEGGHLVAGLTSRVVYKANLNNPANITIQDDKNQVINQFEAKQTDIGIFSITPVAGISYYAVITESDGNIRKIKLPSSLSSGYVITADNLFSKKGIRISIDKTPGTPNRVRLLAHTKKNIFVNQFLSLETMPFINVIPNALFNEGGIVHIAILDTLNIPLAERMVWLPQNLNILTLSSKLLEESRNDSLIAFEISAKDLQSNPAKTPISISITRADSNDEVAINGTNDAKKYFTTTSDIDSEIPAELISDSFTQRVQLDYWLIAGKWRINQINQELILNQNTFSISGRIRDKDNLAPSKKTAQAFIKSGTAILPTPILLNKEGDFSIDGLSFEGKANMWIQINGYEPSRFTTAITYPSIVFIPPLFINEPKSTPQVSKLLIDRALLSNELLKESKQLAEVTIKGKKIDPMQNDSRRQLYGGQPDYEIIMNDKNVSLGIEGALRAYVPGFKANGSNISYYIDGFLYSKSTTAAPDANVNDIAGKLGLNIYDIDRIDVLTRGTNIGIFGVSGGNGVVNIITKRGASNTGKQKAGNIQEIEGYQIPLEFRAKSTSGSSPTLYWNPSLALNEEGKAIVYLPKSTLVEKIKIKMNTLSSSGQAGSGEQTFEFK